MGSDAGAPQGVRSQGLAQELLEQEGRLHAAGRMDASRSEFKSPSKAAWGRRGGRALGRHGPRH